MPRRNVKNQEDHVVLAMIRLAGLRDGVIDQHVLETTKVRFGFQSIQQVMVIVDRHASLVKLREAHYARTDSLGTVIDERHPITTDGRAAAAVERIRAVVATGGEADPTKHLRALSRHEHPDAVMANPTRNRGQSR